MIEFDEQGHIYPKGIQEIDFDIFKNVFVDKFSNVQRKLIFKHFENFIINLKNEINSNFYVIINGSFTSLIEEPKDIDFVIYIPSNILENIKLIEHLKKEFYLYKNKRMKLLDFYIIPDCENNKNSNFYEIYIKMHDYWIDLFSNTEPNEKGITKTKGFIKIKF